MLPKSIVARNTTENSHDHQQKVSARRHSIVPAALMVSPAPTLPKGEEGGSNDDKHDGYDYECR